jgi:transcriptional regulator with XRE-family HTH domain
MEEAYEMKKATAAKRLGRRIAGLRRSKGFTQKELGRKCGLDRDFIKAIEKGEEDSTLEDMTKISEALGVEPFDLVMVKRGKKVPSNIKKEILEAIDQIQDKKKLRHLLEILRVLK